MTMDQMVFKAGHRLTRKQVLATKSSLLKNLDLILEYWEGVVLEDVVVAFSKKL